MTQVKSFMRVDDSWYLENTIVADINHQCVISRNSEEARDIYGRLGLRFLDHVDEGQTYKLLDPESFTEFDAALAYSDEPDAPAKRVLKELEKEKKWKAVYSEIGAALIADCGLSPEAMFLMTYIDGLSEGYHYLVRNGRQFGEIFPQTLTGKKRHFYIDITVDKRVTWYARPDQESFRLENIPDSLIANLPGRPLRDLISHPVIDQYPFTIDYLIKAEGGWLVYLK